MNGQCNRLARHTYLNACAILGMYVLISAWVKYAFKDAIVLVDKGI